MSARARRVAARVLSCLAAVGIAALAISITISRRRGGEREAAARRGAGLLLAASSVAEDGGSVARVEIVSVGAAEDGTVRVDRIEDPRSAVFHAARCDPRVPGAILTAAGTPAAVARWRRGAGGRWASEELWRAQFGPRSSRVRDLEIAEGGRLGRAAGPVLIVGTHDEGVVAIVDAGGEVLELDRAPHTLVHEIEVGDLDGDGAAEIYATVSPPNTLVPGIEQPGRVVRYVPARGSGRELVVDLAPRHAKEILVVDLDGDGRDELYVVLEARMGSRDGEAVVEEPVEIRRLDARGAWETIARLPDRQTRFLVAGDLDGDGADELVAAGMSSGTWWIRPEGDRWSVTSIDRSTGGFEHAIAISDLDGDGRGELYEADDPSGTLRRVERAGERFETEVLVQHRARSQITWSLEACPAPR